jgi:hypothetical protein
MPSASATWRVREQQSLGLGLLDAELRGEAELRHFRRDAQADAERQVGRAFGGPDDLLQLLDRIEREGADAMIEIGLGDRFLGLDRMHEAKRRFRRDADATRRTSAIDATSKCVMPFSHRIWIRSGEGFALTAYIDRPWNFSTKNRAARAAAWGRRSVTG